MRYLRQVGRDQGNPYLRTEAIARHPGGRMTGEVGEEKGSLFRKGLPRFERSEFQATRLEGEPLIVHVMNGVWGTLSRGNLEGVGGRQNVNTATAP